MPFNYEKGGFLYPCLPAGASARWGTCPQGPFAQATPGPGLGGGPPHHVPAPFGAAMEHRGAATVAGTGPRSAPGLTPAPPKPGCRAAKPTGSCRRGRGGGVKPCATEAAPLVLIKPSRDEVWQQLCVVGMQPHAGGADPQPPRERGQCFISSFGIPGYEGDFTPGLGTQTRLMVIIPANRTALLCGRNSRARSLARSAAAADCMGKAGYTGKTISAQN